MGCQLMESLIAVSWRRWASPKEKLTIKQAGGIGAKQAAGFLLRRGNDDLFVVQLN